MEIYYYKNFKKNYKKRIFQNKKLSKVVANRIGIFMKNPKDPILNTHRLIGAKRNFYSFSVTGDIRIIFYYTNDGKVALIDIGSHNQVY